MTYILACRSAHTQQQMWPRHTAGGMLYPYGQYVHTGHRLYPYNTRSSSIIQARSKVPKSYYDPGPRGSFAEKRRSDDLCMDHRSLQCLTVVRAAAGTTEHWSWTLKKAGTRELTEIYFKIACEHSRILGQCTQVRRALHFPVALCISVASSMKEPLFSATMLINN